jgi:predicted RNase H-like HicB family nuclease
VVPRHRQIIPPRVKGQIMARKHEFQIVVEQDEAGYYVAECPAFKACYAQGSTYEEVIDNIRDVIALCLADLKGKKLPPQPEIIGVRRVQVIA